MSSRDEGRIDRIVGAALVLIALAAGLEASTFEVSFMTDPIGPKALPYLVSGTLLLAGIVSVLRPRGDPTFPPRPAVLRMVGATVAFTAYALILPSVGFFVSTTAVVTALALLFGGPPVRSGAAAAALSAGLWLLFVRALSLPLPVGELWIR